MSLDNIQLSPALVESLYSKSLYELKTAQPVPADIQKSGINFLGSNEKKIVLLVSSDEAIYLPDEELNFLLGILTACKLTMADIALINVSTNPNVIYTHLANQLNAEKIFLFGLKNEILELPLTFPQYQIQKYSNQVYLSAASLSVLQKDKAEKLKLWNCLKTVFEL